MNALDQAFIKAFAKDRTGAGTTRPEKMPRAAVQPPEDGIESSVLVLPDGQQTGQRLRIDRPLVDASTVTWLRHHMVLPIVEQVESYQLEDVRGSAPAQVVFEDRMPLPELVAAQDSPILSGAADQAVEATLDISVRLSKPESNVKECMDAPVDRDVPALAHTTARDNAAADLPSRDSLHETIEARVLEECQPRVLWVEPACPAGPLMNLELASQSVTPLPASAGDGDLAAVCAGLTALDVDLPWLDLRAVDWGQLPESSDAVIAAASSEQPLHDGPADPVVEPAPTGSAEHRPHHSLPEGGEAESASATVAEGRRSLEAFTPAWEVDAFRWPELCQQLDDETGGKLKLSGEELYVATGDGLKVLAVTSAARGEGRSTVALALAHSAARAGSRVALLDADTAHPELAVRLGLESPCDWYSVASQRQSLQDAAVNSLDDAITLFPLMGSHDACANVGDPLLTETLHELTRYFDLVVVDLPPVSTPYSEPAAHATSCPIDMAIVMRSVPATGPELTLAAAATLRRAGVRAVGIIENFLPSPTVPGDG